jgi:peptide/nickel transport system substrate-binding protein
MEQPLSHGLCWRTAFLWLAMGWLGSALGPAARASNPQDTLVVAKAADPQNLDPGVTVDNNDWTITYPSYQRLMRYKVTRGGKALTDVQGDLAETWKVSQDHLTWEFKLRPGQAFEDGTPVDAAAVKFTFDRLLRLRLGPSEAYPPDLGLVTTVVDPLTVHFSLAKPCPYFLATLANNGTGIINPNVMAMRDAGLDAKAYLANHTAGSGPYRLVRWERSRLLELGLNPHYGGPKPALTRILVQIINDPASRRLLLESEDLDLVGAMPVDQMAELAKKADLTVVQVPSLQATYLYLNNRKPPLDNPLVRQAISWAVDYPGIIKDLLKNQATQLRGALPEGMDGYDPGVMRYGFDLKRAKALLDQAKVSHLHLSFLYSPRDSNWEAIAQRTQASLASLGIDVRLENMANSTMRDRIGKGDYDISIGTWSPDFADPYTFMSTLFDSSKLGLAGNRSFYSNRSVDLLLREAATGTDPRQRKAEYQQAQRIAVNDAAYVFLYQTGSRICLRKVVKGFVFNPMLEFIYNFETMHKEKEPLD